MRFTSHVLSELGTTVQVKSASPEKPLVPVKVLPVLPSWHVKSPSSGTVRVHVTVQPHEARPGARPEKSCTTTAPNPAANAFDMARFVQLT